MIMYNVQYMKLLKTMTEYLHMLYIYGFNI